MTFTFLSLKPLRILAWMTAMVVGTTVAQGQPYTSRLGRFQVDQKKGCAPLTVNITNLLAGECTAGKPCTMTFGDNTPSQQLQFSHVYSAPGTYTLSILYGSIGSDDIVITVDQNVQPNFEIYSCSGNRAAIKVTDNAYDQYVIDFTNDGTPEFILPFSNNIQTPSFTYAPAGTYTPSVRGRDISSADNCAAKVQSITTLATLPTPSINKLTSVDAANIDLEFTTATHIQYRLEVAINNGTTFQLFRTLYGTSTLSVSNLKLDDNFYCFRLGAFDPCTNTSTYSNIMCTNKLVVTAQSDQVTVTSNLALTGIVNYTIERLSPTAPPVTVITASNPFVDTDVECKTDYCFRVTTNYGSGRTSTSLEKCVTAFSNAIPTAIDDVTATVTAAGASLEWVQDPLFIPTPGYNVQRSSGTGGYAFYKAIATSPFVDNVYTTQGQYCYKIDYVDKCGILSAPGGDVCPVQLNGTLDQSNAISLSWSDYKGWKNGVKEYVLEKYNLQGVLIQSVVQTTTAFLDNAPDPDNQYVRYVVRAIPNDATRPEGISNEKIFVRNSNLYYPTAFTPNKDNLNDGFIVQGQYIVKIKLSIFDRWGVLLFSTEKNEPWDGNSNGKPMPPSTYVWKAEITDKAGQNYSTEGTVALMR